MPKRIVICCDGTWNVPDQRAPSNVTKIALAVAPRDCAGIEQRTYYDTGVGTGAHDRIRGGAFGWGLSNKIKDAYRFLIMNYDPGDELFFFGFSRGAYTARSTVGFIRNSGVLKRQYLDQIGAAYRLYRRRDSASHPAAVESQLYRKTYSYEPRIKFIGVWDTVGELGIPFDGPLHVLNYRWRFHDVQLSSWVDNAFQALAIDEKRRPFKPSVWQQGSSANGQVVEQVWFAGVHTNVGGGYPRTGLADIALLWMAARAQGCGLAFDGAQLQGIVKPDPLGQLQNSQTWYYKLLGGDYIRPMGGRAHESAAQSAVDRENNPESNYHPDNLKKFLAGGGLVTPVP